MRKIIYGIFVSFLFISQASAYDDRAVVGFDLGWEEPLESASMTTDSCCDYDSAEYKQNWGVGHTGIDMGMGHANEGDDVVAIADGIIIAKKLHCNVGDTTNNNLSLILVEHNTTEGESFIAIYGHTAPEGMSCDGIRSKYNSDFTNERVSAGEIIGHLKKYGDVHLHFGIAVGSTRDTVLGAWGRYTGDTIPDYWRDPETYLSNHHPVSEGVSRARALQLIFDRFNITAYNTDFNTYLFGDRIQPPSDVSRQTEYYSYIVTAYNKGVVGGSNGMFKPNTNATLAEFLIMIDRAIPIPLNNPDYKEYPYSNGEWFASYVRAAYNAGILENRRYAFDGGVSETLANEILDRAYEYFLGARSGISIYAQWTQKYADIDLYLLNDSVAIEEDDEHRVSNMQSLRDSNDIVYWNKHTSTWGAALDYDSWGANGNQPWAGNGEERITVDSQMVKRPGRYDIVMCYYDNWDNASMPENATVSWWGINRGNNINTGGSKFTNTVPKGECLHVGYLITR